MLTNQFKSNCAMHTDTYLTGKEYPKLDSYIISKERGSLGQLFYLGSSCQFKTQRRYKEWLKEYHGVNIKIIIKKGEI